MSEHLKADLVDLNWTSGEKEKYDMQQTCSKHQIGPPGKYVHLKNISMFWCLHGLQYLSCMWIITCMSSAPSHLLFYSLQQKYLSHRRLSARLELHCNCFLSGLFQSESPLSTDEWYRVQCVRNWSVAWCSTWSCHPGFTQRREKPEWGTNTYQTEQTVNGHQINNYREEALMCESIYI